MCVVFVLHCLSLVCVAPIELLPFGLARRSVVVWFSTLLTLPTWPGVSAVLPERVLFPPSCTLIGYPFMIRAQGHHALLLCLWWFHALL
jgi:hypothetical protein